MSNLSVKSQDLLQFMRKDYIEEGYMYSGSWPYTSLKEQGFDKEAIHELQKAGKIQRRNCDDYAFELSAAERGALITDHSLCSVWYEKVGEPFLLSIQQEAHNAAEIPYNKETGFMRVRTMKSNKDFDNPDNMEVNCPFTIGQVLDLEFDLRKNSHRGYADSQEAAPGRRLGKFMVTDVIHNLLVYPRMNMIEIQSLCEDFNKFYPQQRTMMVFEDILLARMKNRGVSLSEQIQSASDRSGKTVEPTKTAEKEITAER